MKTKLLSLLLLILCFSMFGKPVDQNRAKTVGLYFIRNKTNSTLLSRVSQLNLIYKVNAESGETPQERTLFYVFNAGNVGYVIVAGDDTVSPILGYSDQGNFITENMPANIQKWLKGYKKEILYILDNNLRSTDEIDNAWFVKPNNMNIYAKATSTTVSPLVKTYWDQDPYYNELCPTGTVTGCVATAMAQVLKYWGFPASGLGYHSYNDPKYGTQTANFASTTYQWSSMPNSISGSNNAIATLMYHCGVSVDMTYDVASAGGSGAYVIESDKPTACAEYALKTYFGYSSALKGVKRTGYSDAQWISALKTELNAGRPVIYSGFGSEGGHCFVADGFDANNYIHFNWGWSGNSDGYFQINALNPSALGSGGGGGGFNTNQQILLGVQPPANTTVNSLSLTGNLVASASTINYKNPFTVTTNIKNNGTNSFTGDLAVSIYDSSSNFVDQVEIKTNTTLATDQTYADNLVFSNPGMLSMLPGTYSLKLYYRPTGGSWKTVDNGASFTNSIQMTVANTNSIALNSVMTVSPGTTLIQGEAASVNLDIINRGTTTYTGTYMVSLLNLDGSFAQYFSGRSESYGLDAGQSYSSSFLNFSTSSIKTAPGSYLIALQYLNASGDWTLAGSDTNFINPIKVTVVDPALVADVYEVNDAINQSYSLPLTFSSNTASVKTVGSSCHSGTDNDFYKIVLPSGFNYNITPRLQDSESSDNGNAYTLDASFSYSTDGVKWSNTYDDVISGKIFIPKEGTIYFHTAPFYQGDTGSYLLDVTITRSAALAVDENQFAENINIYPNPAKDFVIVNLNKLNIQPNQVELINIQGQTVFSLDIKDQTNTLNIPLTTISEGIYFLQLQTIEGTITKKLIVNK